MRMDCITESKEKPFYRGWKAFCVLFLMIEFTFGKILKPHNITIQKLLGILYHNQFVYVMYDC